jgi:hypothetical protein
MRVGLNCPEYSLNAGQKLTHRNLWDYPAIRGERLATIGSSFTICCRALAAEQQTRRLSSTQSRRSKMAGELIDAGVTLCYASRIASRISHA